MYQNRRKNVRDRIVDVEVMKLELRRSNLRSVQTPKARPVSSASCQRGAVTVGMSAPIP